MGKQITSYRKSLCYIDKCYFKSKLKWIEGWTSWTFWAFPLCMTKHTFLCWFGVNLSLNKLQENCAQTKCFSSTKGPVVDQMVKSCIKQFGALWLFPPSQTNTEVDSPLIDVKSTNHNWDRSVFGQNNNPHLRSNVVRITWFQVTIERQDLSGFSCPRFPCKAPTCGLCPVLHGRSTEKFVPTLWRTICTISWCGFPCKWTLWKRFCAPFFPQAALKVGQFRLVTSCHA